MVNKGIHGGQTKIQKYENGQDKKTKWSRQKNEKSQDPSPPLGLLRGFAFVLCLGALPLKSQRKEERPRPISSFCIFVFSSFPLTLFVLTPFVLTIFHLLSQQVNRKRSSVVSKLYSS